MSAFFIFSGKVPSSMDLLNIISSGATMDWDSCLSRRLLMLSYPLLVLFGRPFSRPMISSLVVGVRNMLLECSFNPWRYALRSWALHSCFLAKLGPTEAKNSLKVLVIFSPS